MAPKTVLITGSSEGGIGDALAKAFHKRGLRVFATARNLAKVQHLKDMGIEVLQLDVVDSNSIKEAVADITSRTGGTLDFLVNNSGGGYGASLLDADLQTARNLFELNVFALMAVTQAFAPLLIASKGTIINISSVLSISPMPWQGWYNASKAAVSMLSDVLRIEMSPFGVKVINVITGGIKTKFFDNLPVQKLPPNSYYEAARDTVEYVLDGSVLDGKKQDVDRYAKAVVANALRSSPKVHFWAGSGAWPTWFVDTFGWSTVWDIILGHVSKMSLVTKQIRAAAKRK